MAGPGRIYQAAERFRKELLANDRAAATRIIQRYGESWLKIQASLYDLQDRIAQVQREGYAVSPAWLYQEERYLALLSQIEREIGNFSGYAEAEVVQAQMQAMALAEKHSYDLAVVESDLIDSQIGVSWTRLPTAAVEEAIGFLQPDSPLHRLLAKLPGDAVDTVARELVAGITIGTGPRQTARHIRKALGGNLARALTIARTETVRAYREATHQSYRANMEVLNGWIWICAKSARTCAACLAMDGTVHKVTERLDDHPNGRCVMAPLPKGIEMPKRQTGAEWLDEQPVDVQRKILGGDGFEAYHAGRVQLSDFVGRKRSADWGTMRYARSLREILGPDEEQLWRRAAIRRAPLEMGKPSVEDIERWARRNYSHIKWTLDGMDPEAARRTLLQLDTLAQEYPHVMAELRVVRVGDLDEDPSKGTLAYAWWSHRELAFNVPRYKDHERLKRDLEYLEQIHHFAPGCDTVEAIVTHEFGHLVRDEALDSASAILLYPDRSGTGLVSNLVEMWTLGHRTGRLSNYANVNINELFAEMFSSLYHTPVEQQLPEVKRLRWMLDAIAPKNRIPEGEWKFLTELEDLKVRDEAIDKVIKLMKEIDK